MTQELDIVATAVGLTETQRATTLVLHRVWQGFDRIAFSRHGFEVTLPIAPEQIEAVTTRARQMLFTPAEPEAILQAMTLLKLQSKWPTKADEDGVKVIDDPDAMLAALAMALERRRYSLAVIVEALDRAIEGKWAPSPGEIIQYCKTIHQELHGAVLFLEADPEVRRMVAYDARMVYQSKELSYRLLRARARAQREEKADRILREKADAAEAGLQQLWTECKAIPDDDIAGYTEMLLHLPNHLRAYVKAHADDRREYLDWLPKLSEFDRNEFIRDVAYYEKKSVLDGFIERNWRDRLQGEVQDEVDSECNASAT